MQYLGELGASVKVIKNDELKPDGLDSELYSHIVVSPGPCTPNESGISIDVIKRFQGSKPILGVCLGHQCIAALHGAKITKAKDVVHGKTSEVSHDETGLFENINTPLIATRYHSLIIDETSLGDDFEVSARDRDNQIMGIRHRVWNQAHNKLVGVQFHPESIMTPDGKALLKNFIS